MIIKEKISGVISVNLRLISCLLLFFFAGCETAGDHKPAPPTADHGQFLLYLNLPSSPLLNITFHLSSAAVVDEKGVSRELLDTVRKISSDSALRRQFLLAEQYLPEGRYKSLSLKFDKALVSRGERVADLALPEGGVELLVDLQVTRGRCVTLFINWDPDSSIADGYLFQPALTVRGEAPEVSSLLIYVTNEDSGTVSVINRSRGEVVSTLRTGLGPRGIAAVFVENNPRVYTVNSDEDSFSVIDSVKNTLERVMPVRFGRKPEALAVAKASSQKNLIFTANYNSNTVSVIDAGTYQETEKIDVGSGPVAIAADPPAESLTVSGALSEEDMNLLRAYRQRYFNVYVANRHSNNVSVLKMDTVSGRVDKVMLLAVKWEPVALEVDYQKGKVYVANYGHEDLSVIDILQLARGNSAGAVSAVNNVGPGVVDVIADPVLDRLYLLREYPGEVITLRLPADPFRGVRSLMPSVIGTVSVGEAPRSFLLDEEDGKLYVVNRGSDTVSVINKTTGKEERIIPVGKRPYGIAMFPQ